MTATLVNIVDVELYAGSDWQDVSSRVLTSDDGGRAITIGNGNRGSADAIPETASMRLVMDDTDGSLTPWNPMGPWYGTIDQNTPIRCSLCLVKDAFDRTVSSGWGSTSGSTGLTAYAWVNTGGGGSVLASDWNVTPGAATHSVPAASAYRQSLLDDVEQVNVEQLIAFRLPTANVTGGNIEPANLLCRVNATGQIMLRVTVKTDETITLQYKWVSAGGSETNLSVETTAAVTNTGQWIWVAASVENIQYRAKIWADGDQEPLGWLVNQSYDAEETFVVEGGAIGVRTGVASGNSNTKPVIVSYKGYRFRSPRFTGFIASISPQPVDPSLNLITTEIEAAGVLRQIMQGEDPLDSTLRRSIPEQDGVVAYWPLEDDTSSTEFASALAGYPPMRVLDGTPSFAAFSDLDASKPLPYANKAIWKGEIPSYAFTGDIQVRFFMKLPATGSVDGKIICRFFTAEPGAWFWELLYHTGGDLELRVMTTETAVVYTTGTLNLDLDGVLCRVSIELSEVGSDVAWKVYALPVGSTGTTVYNSTMAGIGLRAVNSLLLNQSWLAVADRLDQCVFGHVTVQSEITSIFDVLEETNAYEGERTFTRLGRLGRENGFTADVQPGPQAHLYMGPQRPANLQSNIRECIEVGNGFVYEARGDSALMYREVTSVYSRDFALTLSLSQLVPPWRPTIDDRDSRNRWTVSRVDGSSATAEQSTGRRSTLPPGEGGIGPYASSDSLNTQTDASLADQASFRVSIGTVTEPRYPDVVVERARPEVLQDATASTRLLDVRPGDRIEITGTAPVYLYDTVRVLMTGWTEELSRFRHTFTFPAVPAAPYDAWKIESTEYGRLDASASTVDISVDTTATALTVVSGVDWWTSDAGDLPIPIRVDGEVMSATAVTNPTPSLIAVGTAAHADNATVTPGLPGGTTTTKDVLLILAASRNTAAAPTQPAEYTTLVDAGNVRLFGKYHDGSESAPNVAVTGGSAGDTMSAVMASFRNMSLTMLGDPVTLSNSSAQNIAFMGAFSRAYKAMAIFIGWKQDDFTSVATITNATEISEASTTTGNDQSLVWDYQALASPAGVIDGSFSVTGGASAISKGIVVLFAVPQVMTVTRSVNGVVKAHTEGASVNIFRQPHLAL